MASAHGWRELRFQFTPAEDGATLAFELGAQGTVIVSETEFIAYLDGAAAEVAEGLLAAGGKLLSDSAVKEQNWTALCPELTEPLLVGGYKIQPVVDAESSHQVPPAANEIRIIPGLGFGTGHHTATKLCFEAIQKLPAGFNPKRALDIGTGSGILAFLIAKHLGIPVDAFDNDPLAVENAKENGSLNLLPAEVTLWCGTIESCQQRYELIAANLYAELLVALEPQIQSCITPGGVLVVSGVMESLAGTVQDCYSAAGWSILSQRLENGWWGAQLRR